MDCTDSVFFPEPLYSYDAFIETSLLQAVIVFAPFSAHLVLWLLWELWSKKRPKRRIIVSGATFIAALLIAAQIFFLQRFFQVLRCLDVFENMDRWVIGGVTIVGALNSITVGALTPRAPRTGATLLVAYGLCFAASEWVLRTMTNDIPKEKEEILAVGLPPLLCAQLLSYAMSVAALFRVQTPFTLQRRALRSRPCRRLEAVQLQSDPVLTRRLETYTTTAPHPPPVYCGF